MLDFVKGKLIKFDDLVHASYDNLPIDKYHVFNDKPFRFRRLDKVIVNDNSFNLVNDTDFFQDNSINHYAGGTNRKYENIESKVHNIFVDIFKSNFSKFINFSSYELGFHQIRIKCGLDFVGYPVPEGWHKDGFDFVVIMNISSTNILGGVTKIRSNLKDNFDHYSCLLDQGDYLLVNDKIFYHYTDPINVNDINKDGYRDSLIITIKIN